MLRDALSNLKAVLTESGKPVAERTVPRPSLFDLFMPGVREENLPVPITSKGEVDQFFTQVAAAPKQAPVGHRGRLIFAMDATSSREPSWDRACHIQGQMFEATASLGELDIQLVYFRGLYETKTSSWCDNGKDLLRQMTEVRCLAGPTQIGRLLAHAIKETKREKINAVVFIGDCVEEHVGRLSTLAGELGLLGVPVFMFHELDSDPEASKATAVFETIAKITGGAYCPFNVASAQTLKELLSAIAVYAVGGWEALAEYDSRRGGMVSALLLSDQRNLSPPLSTLR
ncbi:VWA domain-containing protein [uncultured Gammaproteobacteria bacterium]